MLWGHYQESIRLSFFLKRCPQESKQTMGAGVSLTQVHVNLGCHGSWLGSSEEEQKICISKQLPGDAQGAGPEATQRAVQASPRCSPARTTTLSLLPQSCLSLRLPHNAVFSLRTKAILHSAPNFFFSLYLIWRLPKPALRGPVFQEPAFCTWWLLWGNSFKLRRFWFCSSKTNK